MDKDRLQIQAGAHPSLSKQRVPGEPLIILKLIHCLPLKLVRGNLSKSTIGSSNGTGGNYLGEVLTLLLFGHSSIYRKELIRRFLLAAYVARLGGRPLLRADRPSDEPR